MKRETKSLRTPLGRVRGLGAAHHGTDHWWGQRLTSLALIPLSLYGVGAFFNGVVFDTGYDSAVAWLSSPFAAVLVIFFIGAAFHHAVSGLQVVIEDYVHGEALKLASLLLIKFFAVFFVLLGTLAVIKVLFFAIFMIMQQAHG